MNVARGAVPLAVILMLAALIATWLAVESRAQGPVSFAGAWTMNHDLSDQPIARDGDRDGGDRRGDYGGRGGGRGGYGRGGLGGGRGGYGRAGGGREANDRMRDALRDIMNPPDHLTITQTDSMVAITGPDGRTTRLSPDGSKIKDGNTSIERKTRWDGTKLVTEISGAGPGKITQTYTLDPEHHQLRITALMEARRGREPRTVMHVYDADGR